MAGDFCCVWIPKAIVSLDVLRIGLNSKIAHPVELLGYLMAVATER